MFHRSHLIDLQANKQRLTSAEIYENAIAKLRGQVWLTLMVVMIIAIILSRLQRYSEGVTTQTPLAAVLMVVQLAVFIGGILFRNTRYVRYFQTFYLLLLHLLAPLSIYFFGGVFSLGETNLFLAVVISLLFGFRRWMYVSFSLTGCVVIYVIYLGLTDRAGRPFFESEALFYSSKMIIYMILILLSFFLATQFYRRLLESYANFSAEQAQINAQLQDNAAWLALGTQNLRQSRQQIVTARAEERRRLRRDLHDGLGPTLAAQVFRVGAARNLYQKQPAKADHFLSEIETSVAGMLGDVRQLVDQLRPALLDQLGLLGAVESHANSLQVPFSIELQLSVLPDNISAATEVAIWRIVQTSLDNVARHADASICWLTLEPGNEGVRLTIADNGVGLASDTVEGIGLTSIRERTAELQGTVSIGERQPHGTILTVQFPVEQEVSA